MAPTKRWARQFGPCTGTGICACTCICSHGVSSRRRRHRPRSLPSQYRHRLSLLTTTPSILFALLALLATVANADCYDSSGQRITIPDYLSCRDTSSNNNNNDNNNNKNGASTPMCCASNRLLSPGANEPGSAALTRDECMANGLCRNTWLNGSGIAIVSYYRDFCDNKEWEGCLGSVKVGDDSHFLSADKTVRVTPCEKTENTTKWCLGSSNAACCLRWDTHSEALTIPLVLGDSSSSPSLTLSFSSSSFSSPASISSSSDQTSTSSPSPTLANKPSSSTTSFPSPGAIAGIAVGVSVSVLLMLLIGYILGKKHRLRRRQRLLAAAAAAATGSNENGGYSEIGDTGGNLSVEMSAVVDCHQLEGRPRPSELGDSTDGLMPVELGNGRSRAGSSSRSGDKSKSGGSSVGGDGR